MRTAFIKIMSFSGMLLPVWPMASLDLMKDNIAPDQLSLLGIRYLDHLEYAFPESKLPRITEKNPRPEYQPESYIDDIKNKRAANVYIKYVNDKCGYGVFAAQDIPALHIIAEYTGIVRKRGFSKVKNDYEYAWGFPPPTKFLIDGKNAGNFTRFINHNDDHNVEMIYIPVEGRWHLAYVAKKPIKKTSNYWPIMALRIGGAVAANLITLATNSLLKNTLIRTPF